MNLLRVAVLALAVASTMAFAQPAPGSSATAAAPPATASKPKPAPPSKIRVVLVTGLMIGVLLLAKPAVNWLSEAMGSMVDSPIVPPDGKKKGPDRLLPYKKMAREELASPNRDAATWAQALTQHNGDESRAANAYVELRAQALYRADLDRKWAAAKAKGGGVLPPRR